MSSALNKYVLYLLILSSHLISEEDMVFNYNLQMGANLVSFPLANENNDISVFFTEDNDHIISNSTIILFQGSNLPRSCSTISNIKKGIRKTPNNSHRILFSPMSNIILKANIGAV